MKLLNLNEVKYINSLGLGVLCQFNRRAQAEGKTLKLVSISSEVREIMEITRLTKFFNIFDSEKEAFESLE